jgi:anti-sigma-K factor RskA
VSEAKMSPDEARELFSEAFEGELAAERRAAFDDALGADEQLRAEYEEFVDTFRTMGRMADADAEQAPDLLHGVQDRLRKRSRGRYYRDRFAQRAGGPSWAMPLLAAMVALLVAVLAWYFVSASVVLEDPPASAPTVPSTD